MPGTTAADPIDSLRAELTRLGARVVPDAPRDRSSIAWRDGFVTVPEVLDAFARRVEWPSSHRYEGSVLWEHDLRLVRFSALSPLPAAFACAAKHPYAIIGESDGGNYLLVVALDDPRPADPIVFVVDHEETERADLRRLGPLSLVLACLESPPPSVVVTSPSVAAGPSRSSILTEGAQNPRCMAFHPDGRRVAWSLPYHGIELWDAVARTRVRHVDLEGQVTSIRFLRDGVRAVSNRFYESVVVWDVESGVVLATLAWPEAFGGTTDAVSPDGRTLVLCDEAGHVAVFDLESGRKVRDLPALLPYCATGDFHADGRSVAFGVDRGRSSACVRVVDIESGRVSFEAEASPDAPTVRVLWSADGRTLVVGEGGGNARVQSWDLATGTRSTLGWQASGVHSMVCHPDGRRVFTSGSEEDGVISVWDLRAGRLDTRLEGHSSGYVTLACDGDGARLVSAGEHDGTVRVWEIEGDPARE